MFYLLYKHQRTTKPSHFNSFFGVKGVIYYVAIAMLIFSRVKITRYFHTSRYQVFVRKLTWYFIGVYIRKTPIARIYPAHHQWGFGIYLDRIQIKVTS